MEHFSSFDVLSKEILIEGVVERGFFLGGKIEMFEGEF
jgi:hypothetical protein